MDVKINPIENVLFGWYASTHSDIQSLEAFKFKLNSLKQILDFAGFREDYDPAWLLIPTIVESGLNEKAMNNPANIATLRAGGNPEASAGGLFQLMIKRDGDPELIRYMNNTVSKYSGKKVIKLLDVLDLDFWSQAAAMIGYQSKCSPAAGFAWPKWWYPYFVNAAGGFMFEKSRPLHILGDWARLSKMATGYARIDPGVYVSDSLVPIKGATSYWFYNPGLTIGTWAEGMWTSVQYLTWNKFGCFADIEFPGSETKRDLLMRWVISPKPTARSRSWQSIMLNNVSDFFKGELNYTYGSGAGMAVASDSITTKYEEDLIRGESFQMFKSYNT